MLKKSLLLQLEMQKLLLLYFFFINIIVMGLMIAGLPKRLLIAIAIYNLYFICFFYGNVQVVENEVGLGKLPNCC